MIGVGCWTRRLHLERLAGSSVLVSFGCRLHATMKTLCFRVGTPTSVAATVASSTEHHCRSRRGRKVSRHSLVPANLTGHSTIRIRARHDRKTLMTSVVCVATVLPVWSGSYRRHALPIRISGLASVTASLHLGLAKEVRNSGTS